MNLDLWMHQNTLMFSRLQTLWFVQIGLLALASYLYVPHPDVPSLPILGGALGVALLAKFSALLCAISTFGLWVMARTDRSLRNIYRRRIEALALGFFPGSLGQVSIDRDVGVKIVEPVFYYCVFTVFIAIDLFAARFYGLDERVVFVFLAIFLFAPLFFPVIEAVLINHDRNT